MADALPPVRRKGDGWIALPGAGRAPPAPDLRARFIDSLRIVTLRGIGDGIDAIRATVAAYGLELPEPARISGDGPFVLWRRPGEWLLLETANQNADRILRDLAPGTHASVCAIDQSQGVVAIELEGGAIDAVLSRLVDASAIPCEPGRGTRARLGDIAVTLLRFADARAWLIAERSVEAYLVEWIVYAWANARDACAT